MELICRQIEKYTAQNQNWHYLNVSDESVFHGKLQNEF